MTERKIIKDGRVYISSSRISFFDAEMVKKHNVAFFPQDGEIYIDYMDYIHAIREENRALAIETEMLKEECHRREHELKTQYRLRYIAYLIALPVARAYWFLTRKLGM